MCLPVFIRSIGFYAFELAYLFAVSVSLKDPRLFELAAYSDELQDPNFVVF